MGRRPPRTGLDDGRGRTDERGRGLGGAQVEGHHAVRALLVAGRRRVREMWCSNADHELVALAHDEGVRVRTVSRDQLDARAKSAAPQGVIAFTTDLVDHEVDDLLADPHAFLVALDGVTDPGNLGAVLRTAEAAGATGAVLPRHRSAAVTPTVAKAAAGAIEYLPMTMVAGIPNFLERARRADVWTVGLDERGDTSVFDLDLGERPVVVVLGAEGRGIAPLTAKRCDLLVRIPMGGHLESLNVSAAAAISLFQVTRAREGT